MEFGAAIFFTDYSMGPVEFGRALEARGFESLWAPEHSHIPLSRQSPFPQGGDDLTAAFAADVHALFQIELSLQFHDVKLDAILGPAESQDFVAIHIQDALHQGNQAI